MTHTLHRNTLYDLVWAEPLRLLAPRFGVSDTALRKACQKAGVPTPDRGYWAKREAGKGVVKAALPPRPPGMDPEVSFGGQRSWYRSWTREELLGPIPPPPVFDENLEALRARIAAGIGRVPCPTRNGSWHPGIRRLLDQDEERRQKAATATHVFSWDQPVFVTPLERRRLQIVNSLFLAVGRFGGRATLRGREARDLCVSFHQQHVGLTLDRARPSPGGKARPAQTDGLALSILKSASSSEARSTWSDEPGTRLEQHLPEIATELVLSAEVQLREGAARLHQWRIEAKARLEDQLRQEAIERDRRERERLEQLEQARIAGLLAAADDFRRARDIRAYVAGLGDVLDPTDPARWSAYLDWSTWALAQADRIDPALRPTFSDVPEADTEPPRA